MIEIRQRCAAALSRETLTAATHHRVQPAYARDSLHRIGLGKSAAPAAKAGPVTAAAAFFAPVTAAAAFSAPVAAPASVAPVARMRVPELICPAARGQKSPLPIGAGSVEALRVCFGWNVTDPRCDMDASAFLLADNGRVISDDWFVFYGQTESPDHSVSFQAEGGEDREVIQLDFSRLDPRIKKIVFVLTINEATERKLHFGMVRDAYIRVMNARTNREIISFRVDEAYSSVTSMTIGEIYLHNGQWKFNPVDNGVNRDLAGQCEIYGVNIG